MRIYLDGMFFRSTGVGRVYESLLGSLLEDEKVETVVTAVPLSEREPFLERYGASGVQPRFLPYGPMSAGDLTLKSLALRRLSPTISLYYYPGHNVPMFAPSPYVLTVNDATVFTSLVQVPAIQKAAFRRLLRRAIRGARRVVTISKTASADLIGIFPETEGKIETIHPWVDDNFFTSGHGTLPGPAAEHAIGHDFLLYLGLRIKHKNLDGLLAAFELLAPEFPDLRLVVAGRRYQKPDMVDRWRLRSRFADRLVEVEDPTDAEIRALLAVAKVFVFPSLAEGFGLPPLEAMAAGLPVVCSDLPVFKELHAGIVQYVDPLLPDSIARGVREVLLDDRIASRLGAAGREHARRFRRQVIEPEYLRLIHSFGSLD